MQVMRDLFGVELDQDNLHLNHDYTEAMTEEEKIAST